MRALLFVSSLAVSASLNAYVADVSAVSNRQAIAVYLQPYSFPTSDVELTSYRFHSLPWSATLAPVLAELV